MDIGCGTGLLGQVIADYGCKKMHGVDISKNSIEISKSKNIYSALFQGKLPWERTINNVLHGTINWARFQR